MALIPWSFHFETKQLEKLRELSKRTRVPQSAFIREGLDYVLKKYGYLLTMTPFTPEKALARLLGDKYEETVEEWVRRTGLNRVEVEMQLLRRYLNPLKDQDSAEGWRPKRQQGWRNFVLSPRARASKEKARLIEEWLAKERVAKKGAKVEAKIEAEDGCSEKNS